MQIKRFIDLASQLKNKSIFLFGPRQTGKSWLIRNTLHNCKIYNLLKSDTYLKLSHAPQRLREEYDAKYQYVVIDEIQRLPILLNEVHLMIEELGVHFLLTGSSARKLRRGGVNLLGGRAHMRYLHPLSYGELRDKFDLAKALNYGLLPSVYFSSTPEDDLNSYIGTYLQEEIAAEGLVRNIPAFSRFLVVAALCNAKMINYTKIANDAQMPRSTVQEYFAILQDTLLAHELPAWGKSIKRKPIMTSKYYLFDLGVIRMLQGKSHLVEYSTDFGEAFETYIFHELKTFVDYHQKGKLYYWRSQSGFEVDFILQDECAIEVKTSQNIAPYDLKNLLALREEKICKCYIIVCRVKERRVEDGIEIVPWQEFVTELWSGRFGS